MAYCKNCGAYVPDGHTKCLACGLDQNEESNKEYGFGSAAQADPRRSNRQNQEELRRRMEEQRKKQQEDSRRWAEAERQRRQQEQEEEARRRREAETEGTATWTSPAGSETARPKAAQSNKLLAALSYLSVLFVLPFIFCKDDKYAMFHARQGAILFAVTAVGELLGSAFGLGWIVTLMHLYWIYKGMTNANDGKMDPLPYIGNLFSGR